MQILQTKYHKERKRERIPLDSMQRIGEWFNILLVWKRAARCMEHFTFFFMISNLVNHCSFIRLHQLARGLLFASITKLYSFFVGAFVLIFFPYLKSVFFYSSSYQIACNYDWIICSFLVFLLFSFSIYYTSNVNVNYYVHTKRNLCDYYTHMNSHSNERRRRM